MSGNCQGNVREFWTDSNVATLIIFDTLSPTINHISEIKVINPIECLIFVGCHTKNQGLTYADAAAYANALHDQTTMWIGHCVKMHYMPCTLKDTQNDLRMVREFTRRQTEDRIQEQRGAARREIER